MAYADPNDFEPLGGGATAVADPADFEVVAPQADPSDFEVVAMDTVPAEPVAPLSSAAADLASRVPAGIAQASADSAAGLTQFLDDAMRDVQPTYLNGKPFAPSNAAEYQRLQESLNEIRDLNARTVEGGGGLPDPQETTIRNRMLELEKDPGARRSLESATQFLRDVSARSAEDYGVDPARDAAFASKVVSGAGSIVPALASGPLAPVTIAGMMGESGRKDAEASGATPAQQKQAFYLNAAVGAVSEALMGVPALLRSAKAVGMPPATYRELVKTVTAQVAKSSAREGAQEGIEKTAENLIANTIVGYDKERGTFKDVPESIAVGGVIGAPVGGVVQTAESLPGVQAALAATPPSTTTAETPAPSALPTPSVEQSSPVPSEESAPVAPELQVAAERAAEAGAVETAKALVESAKPISEPPPKAPPAPPATRPEQLAPAVEQTTPTANAAAVSEPRPDYVGGPGAMGPVEAAAMESAASARATSTKNAVMEAERVARGADPIIKEARRTNAETLDKAEAALEENPNRGQEVVEKLRTSGVREISVADEAVLLVEKVRLRNERNAQAERAADPNSTPEERAVAHREWEIIEQKINEMDQATHASGAEWGRLGQFRQRMLRDDFTFEAMERRARVEKGDALTPQESAKIKEQADRIAELETKLEEAQKARTEKDSTKAADETTKRLKDEAKNADAGDKAKGRKVDLGKQRENIIDGLRKRVAEGEPMTSLGDFVQRLALNFVRSGVTERAPLVGKVHEVLAKMVPEITPSQTRDLISGYGEFKELSHEPAKVTLRGLKGEMQQIGKIEDMQNRIAPKKTGMERRTPTDEERRLIREVNELKKKGGFDVTDPARQLKTAMDAIKTRLRNEIRDLDTAIADKQPLVSKKGTLEYDAEAAALKTQRDAKKAEYDQLFPKEPLTQEQLIARAATTLDRSIAQLEGDLKTGKLYGDKAAKLTTPELDAKRARLEALRAERDLLRDLDTARVEATKEAQLLKAIENAEKALPAPKEGTSTADTARVAELKAALAEARKKRDSSPEATQRRIDSATDAVKKSISEYDRRLREGDLATRETTAGPSNAELDALRAERDAMETLLRELRQAEKPKKSAEEIALQAYKTRTANRIAELESRVAKGDFSPKPPPKPFTMDKTALDLKFQIEKVKEQYNRALLADRLSKRSLPMKIIGTGAEILNTARAIITSLDLSAVLRQGGFIAFGNPLRAFRAFPDMLKALASEKQQLRVMEEIKARPNAELYQQSKLYLAETEGMTLNKLEEAYMSRWANKIPLVAGSQRAYVTFLNRLRADTFDALSAALGKNGKLTPDEAKVIASFINVATGRGNIGRGNGAVLNTVFFSPRYVASRFQLLAGSPIYGGTARTRKAIAAEYGKFLAGAAIIYALLLTGSDEPVETDPRSSDFGKVKWGDTRIDPLGGLLQSTVLLSRLATGETKTQKGIMPIRASDDTKLKFGTDNAYEVLSRFARTKFSPSIGAGVNLLAGENVVGERVGLAEAAKEQVIPLSLRDVYDTMVAQGVPKGTALTVLGLFGLGIQTYADKKPEPVR